MPVDRTSGHLMRRLLGFLLKQRVQPTAHELAEFGAATDALFVGRLHFETPFSLGALMPFVRTGTAFGPGGGLPPANDPAFDVRDFSAHPVAAFMLLPSFNPDDISFSLNG